MSDELKDTFDFFFGETEETHGTGTVRRLINGILTDVIVDEEEHEAFQARKRAEMDERARQSYEAALRQAAEE